MPGILYFLLIIINKKIIRRKLEPDKKVDY